GEESCDSARGAVPWSAELRGAARSGGAKRHGERQGKAENPLFFESFKRLIERQRPHSFLNVRRQLFGRVRFADRLDGAEQAQVDLVRHLVGLGQVVEFHAGQPVSGTARGAARFGQSLRAAFHDFRVGQALVSDVRDGHENHSALPLQIPAG
ncbi:hypothetical protein LCGC14_2865710, partial [marine sediment metagenome]